MSIDCVTHCFTMEDRGDFFSWFDRTILTMLQPLHDVFKGDSRTRQGHRREEGCRDGREALCVQKRGEFGQFQKIISQSITIDQQCINKLPRASTFFKTTRHLVGVRGMIGKGIFCCCQVTLVMAT